MPWDGAGNFRRTDGVRTGSAVWVAELAADTDVRADFHDVHDEDLADGLEACLNRNGENAMAANQPMGGFKLTGLGAGSARTDSLNIGQGQDQGFRWAGTAGGTADALTIGPTPAITAYADGQEFWFFASADNTADDPTVNVSAVGALVMQSKVGVGVKAREIRSGALLKGVIQGVSGTPTMIIHAGLTIETPLPRSYGAGCALSNNSTDADHDIDIAAGAWRDSTNASNIVLASALTKRLDAAWAVGTGNGMLDTGTIDSDTWYAVYLIARPDTGVVDVVASLSFAGPTQMPANFTVYRYIGAVLTDDSANIVPVIQDGDRWELVAPPLDVNEAITDAESHTLTVPRNTTALINVMANASGTDGATGQVRVVPTDTGNAGINTTTRPLPSAHSRVAHGGAGSISLEIGISMAVRVDASSQVSIRGTGTVRIETLGWIDDRGRHA